MKRFVGLLFVSLLVFTACKSPQPSSANEHLVMATLYQQRAAEYRALCYQAFNLGRWQLNAMLDTLKSSKKPAIVVDIDETLLDNSPYEAYLIKSGNSYPTGWKDWVTAALATPLPGAVDFLNFVQQKGVDIFYVSNRKIENLEATLQNLKQAGFPQVTPAHLLLRTNTSSKEARRQTILKTHSILLFFGDNLNDFAALFEKKSVSERARLADQFRLEFGKRFIVLPNAMYGEWEGAIYDYRWGASAQQKRMMRLKALNAFKD